MIRHVFPLLVIVLIPFLSCKKKEGPDGKASISGHVEHHDEAIPNATVYIKYGATELPGTSPGDYDDHTVASETDAHYEFSELQKGDYYLFATGYDSACACDVMGGVPVTIDEKKEAVESDVPVTE